MRPILPVAAKIAFALGLAAAGAAAAADLTLQVVGDKLRRGMLRVGIFSSAEELQRFSEPHALAGPNGELIIGIFARDQDVGDIVSKEVPVDAKARSVSVRIEGLEPGEYAVALFLDVNGNGVLDSTVTRRLLEPWAASRNPAAPDRPLFWDEVRFTLPPEGLALELKLQ